mgnify:CR=1 FL=1
MSLLSPDEAAAGLRISRKTLRGHVKDGTLRYVIIGRGTKRPRIAFTPADRAEFEDRQRRRNAPCPSTG